MGQSALLIEFDSLAGVLGAHETLRETAPAGIVDLVPAARTLLVVCDTGRFALAHARAWIDSALSGERKGGAPSSGRLVEIPVLYDGDDLRALAAGLGVSSEALADAHAGAAWSVAFTGFAPGFGYLVSDDWAWDIPRLSSPRTRVRAGAVGLAGEFSGVYPRDTPGGWQLIGTTPTAMFDPAREEPALLTPGARVRFTPLTETVVAAGASPSAPLPQGDPPATGVRVIEVGLRATIQDQGRAGRAAEGIASSGAVDRSALRTANRLVGNDEGAAGIEVTMGGWRATAEGDLWFAVTGGWGPVLLDGREVDPYEAHAWPSGVELRIDRLEHGAQAYLALRGGVAAAPVAGSRSTDTLAALGPAPLRSGDLVPVGADTAGPVPAAVLQPWGPPNDRMIEVELAEGPRADWFDAEARETLFAQTWTVSSEVDRVGMRLDGPPLARAVEGELPSEGMVPGALQVPPSGRPVVLGPDGPVTGGYPVIAVATEAGRDALAQARPGTSVRFRHAR